METAAFSDVAILGVPFSGFINPLLGYLAELKDQGISVDVYGQTEPFVGVTKNQFEFPEI